MTFTITLQGVLLALLVVLGIGVAIYLLILITNANRLISNTNATLEGNQRRLEEILSHLEEVSGNTAYFSNELRRQYEKNERIVGSLMQTGAESMVLLNDTTARIRALIANANDIVGLVHKIVKGLK